MSKNTKSIFLLLTALVIGICACLPFLAAAVQDRRAQKEAAFGQLPAVELDISGDLSIMEKLWLLGSGSNVELEEGSAAMTRSEVLEAARTGLDPFFAEGLIHRLSISHSNMTPYLYYDPEDLACNKIFWAVVLSHDSDPSWSGVLMLDDETGRILRFYYYSTRSIFSQKDKAKMAYVAAQIYFDQLGMPDLLEKPEAYGVQYLITQEERLNPEMDRGLNYLLLHEQFGMLELSFSVFDNALNLEIR